MVWRWIREHILLQTQAHVALDALSNQAGFGGPKALHECGANGNAARRAFESVGVQVNQGHSNTVGAAAAGQLCDNKYGGLGCLSSM
jgi:hypothetical protein